jgi:hypothetical protein
MPYSQPLIIIPGQFMFATLPPAIDNKLYLAYATDINGGSYCVSDGIVWRPVDMKRIEAYSGTTDASGNFSVTYLVPYNTIPYVGPSTYPNADATTRVRVTASSTTGFTVHTEKNSTVTILTIDVLSPGVIAVGSVPVRVLVIE